MAAEAVGLAVGAAGLLTLFNACVDISKQIQVALHFGDKFDQCHDILLAEKHRLAEWRELLVSYERDRRRLPTKSELEPVYLPWRRLKRLLKDVDDLFVSYDLKIAATSPNLTVHVARQEVSGSSDYAEYETARDSEAQHRHSQTSPLKKAQFAIAGLPKFIELLELIAKFRGHLDSATRHLIATSCDLNSFPVETHQRRQSITRTGKGIQLTGLPEAADAPVDSRVQELTGTEPGSKPPWEEEDLDSPGRLTLDTDQKTPISFREPFTSDAPPSVRDSYSSRYPPEIPPNQSLPESFQSSPIASFSASSPTLPDDSEDPELARTVFRFRRPERVSSTCTARSAPANLDLPSKATGPQAPPQLRRDTLPSMNAAATPPRPFSGNRYDYLIRGGECVSSSVDGKRAAFLTPDGVCAFDTSSVLADALRPTEIPRYRPSGATWTGVAVAGPYLAVWGPSSAGTGLLIHVASQGNSSPHAEYQKSFQFTTPLAAALGGEQEPRLIVSRIGVVAFSDVRRVIVRSKAFRNCSKPLAFPPAPRQDKPRRIVDITISGDFLYCWVMHLTGPTQACLISWDLTDPTTPSLAAAATYNCDVWQDIHNTTLYPYSGGRGCIVGHSARTIFFPCAWPGVRTGPPVRGEECEQLKRSANEICAVHLLGNSSMLVVQNPNKTDLVLYQYPILYNAGGKADIKSGLKVQKLCLDAKLAGGLAISAFEDPGGGGQIVVVAASNGSVEMVRLKR